MATNSGTSNLGVHSYAAPITVLRASTQSIGLIFSYILASEGRLGHRTPQVSLPPS